ncbi:hypothetical protein PDE_04853 [Penicillium oxalicum 114-2]|uniref:Uncharacterized protein n=1 Tax=Penicillium oxalicum (strain 114-2 / CGMCC 5302) TaxID=933388 RepID=S8AUS0_PENO1|nr:hypothetical protein PDE_04853 [Penicillium oxalicum 114-2]
MPFPPVTMLHVAVKEHRKGREKANHNQFVRLFSSPPPPQPHFDTREFSTVMTRPDKKFPLPHRRRRWCLFFWKGSESVERSSVSTAEISNALLSLTIVLRDTAII